MFTASSSFSQKISHSFFLLSSLCVTLFVAAHFVHVASRLIFCRRVLVVRATQIKARLTQTFLFKDGFYEYERLCPKSISSGHLSWKANLQSWWANQWTGNFAPSQKTMLWNRPRSVIWKCSCIFYQEKCRVFVGIANFLTFWFSDRLQNIWTIKSLRTGRGFSRSGAKCLDYDELKYSESVDGKLFELCL